GGRVPRAPACGSGPHGARARAPACRGGLCAYAGRAGKGPARPAPARPLARRPSRRGVRRRRRSRPRQAAGHGRRGRPARRARRPDLRQSAQRGSHRDHRRHRGGHGRASRGGARPLARDRAGPRAERPGRRRPDRRQGPRELPGVRRPPPAVFRPRSGARGSCQDGCRARNARRRYAGCAMMRLAEAAKAVKGRTAGGNPRFTGVSIDTRTLRSGELFVALRGERHDGHAFLGKAQEAGAVAAMVDRAYDAEFPMPVVVAQDTRRGLGDLARAWRARFSLPLIAIAGSNGKTTVKEMLAAILRAHAGAPAVLATEGNLNNDIGVPLMLLRLRAMHRWCALELGMNHPGEIGYLAGIARPTIALVNNAQREHLEFMRSVRAVAEENAAVYEALGPDGIAVVNADDAQADVFRRAAGARRTVEFGLSGAAVTASYTLGALGSEIEIRLPSGSARAKLAIPGLHNVRNALAAA